MKFPVFAFALGVLATELAHVQELNSPPGFLLGVAILFTLVISSLFEKDWS